MASMNELPRRSPFDADRLSVGRTRDLPVLTSSANTSGHSSAEPMDISHAPPSTEPQSNGSPTNDRRTNSSGNGSDKETSANSGPVGAAAAAQQPKVVQTAFIHKLYSMLEDQSIQHLISWSNTNESFVMSPSTEFSKVLASYFKHTNISSFVRQLNMYGFHKVSDVFHTGAPDSPLWEFKHGGGNFKRGDLAGLREIKRRASRHTLIHRDSFSGAPKVPTTLLPPPEVPAAPPAPIAAPPIPQPPPQDASPEARLSAIEYNFHDLYSRLARTEDAFANLNQKCQILSEGLTKCHQWSSELSTHLLTLIPDPENPIHRDASALRLEIARQSEHLRPQEVIRHSYATASVSYDAMAPSTSPRHQTYDTSRRPSMQAPPAVSTPFRAPMPPHLASPRRPGSFSLPETNNSPSAPKPPQQNYTNLPPPPVPQHPQQQHPLANVELPPANLSRRHTSADIRLQGWQGQPGQVSGPAGTSPYESGQNSTHWPSSPYRPAADQEGQQLRNAMAQYDFSKASQNSRHTTPPPEAGAPSYANVGNEAGWQLPGPKFPFRNIDFSAPPTRRSSMASNVHSLLNPADTAEREGEDEPPEERKRKRMM